MVASAETDWLLAATGVRAREFYARIGVELPVADADDLSVRCFANPGAHSNDDRHPSCRVNILTGLFFCQACGAKGNAYQAALIRGWSERDARELAKDHGLFLETEKAKLPNERQLKKWRQQMHDSPMIVARLYEVKGWTAQAIVRCGLGWDGERVTFPIRDQKLNRMGVVRYLPGGDPKSLALPGTKRMLFPAPEVVGKRRPVFVVEGEPDAVSVWSCGHQAVGVPGTGSWRQEWFKRFLGRDVIVLADADSQGRELAARVARDIPHAKWIDIAPERTDGYDVGDMLLEAMRYGNGHREMHGLLQGLAT